MYSDAFLIGQPIRAFHFDLVVTTQIDHVGEPESKQRLDIALSQILEVVGSEQPARKDRAAVRGR